MGRAHGAAYGALIVGPRFDRLLPASILLGAAFMVAVDTLARSAARIEIPLGVLTALDRRPGFRLAFGARPPQADAMILLAAEDLSIGYGSRLVASRPRSRFGRTER